MAIAAVTSATKYHFLSIELERTVCLAFLNMVATRSPLQMHQRCSLPREFRNNRYCAIVHVERFRGGQKLQLSRALQLRVLFRSRRLRRSHPLPRSVGIAVRVIDPIVLEQNPADSSWEPRNRHTYWSACRCHVIVMVIPQHYCSLVISLRCKGIDV